MKASEIRELSTEAIRNRLNDSKEELMRLRFQQATGELTDHSRMRQVRRRIARMLTILNEREQAVRMEGE
ncbi:MAG: 50S ribosomal protein L29 [Anaerolineales bacterium]|jgi:large subunit ribosomal protein L29